MSMSISIIGGNDGPTSIFLAGKLVNTIWMVAALLMIVIFYSIFVGKMIAQKKRGIETNQMGKGQEKSTQRTIERMMKLATYSIVVVEIVSILFGYSVLGEHGKLQGMLLALIGDLIFGIAVYTMRDSWRAGIAKQDKTKMVTEGIYQYSRNPAFLAFDFVYVGILLMYFNWILLLFTVWAMVMFHLQILQEEKYLADVFGEDYLLYKKQTFRYLGRRKP